MFSFSAFTETELELLPLHQVQQLTPLLDVLCSHWCHSYTRPNVGCPKCGMCVSKAWMHQENNIESEILGRASSTNYNHSNNLLKGFAAAKSMFPMMAQVQPSPVRTAVQLSLMLGQSQHPRQAAQHWFGFVYLCFPFIPWLKIQFWGPILKTFQIDFTCKLLCKVKAPHFFTLNIALRIDVSTTVKQNWFIRTVSVQELSIENQCLGQ